MPRRNKNSSLLGDVVLLDSADSPRKVGRLRKSKTSTQHSDCDDDLDFCSNNAISREISSAETNAASDRSFPAEIWDLIGAQIAPEDVGRFSAICRDSYRVSLQPDFWRSLYKRHVPPTHRPAVDLGQLRGLRASVIRALHRVHCPLARRSFGTDTQRLVGARCCNVWKQGGLTGDNTAEGFRSLMCFVFRSPTRAVCNERILPSRCATTRRHRSKLFENVDQDIMALLVVASGGCGRAETDTGGYLANVFGLVVQRVVVTVGAAATRRLRIDFSQTGYKQSGQSCPAVYQPCTVMVDSLLDTRVIHWWQTEFEQLLPTECVSAGRFYSLNPGDDEEPDGAAIPESVPDCLWDD